MKLLITPLLAAVAILYAGSANAASYSTTVLGDGPVAYYRLEETSGTTAADATTNLFDAAYATDADTNGVWTWPMLNLPGIETNSILFRYYVDSSSVSHRGFVNIPYRTELSPLMPDGQHGAPFSVECWVKAITQPPDYSIPLAMFGAYETGIYGNASGWNFYQSPGPNSYWIFNVKNGPFAQASSLLIQPHRWYHLAATFNGSIFVFYVDGVARVTSGAVTTYLADHGYDGQIGAGDRTSFLPFQGAVDDVAFYTNVLTAGQILNHYQTGTNSFSGRPYPPFVVQDPASATVGSGSTARFTVIGDGATPLTFQWLRNSAPISGATANPYSFVANYPADNGANFSVVLSNSFGAVTSAVASLTVVGTLDIDHHPFSITRQAGSNSMAAFRVVASGAVPIRYQWYKVVGVLTNIIAGATNDTLWLSNLQLTDNGSSYFARATNAFVVTNSEPATLSVVPRLVNVPITGHAKVIVADRPTAYWRLDETTGSSTAVDVVGSFDGAYVDSATATTPIFTHQAPGAVATDANTAINIAGGAIVRIPYALELNPVTGPWTFEAWIKPSTLDPINFRTPYSSMWNSDFGGHLFGWNIYQHPEGYWTLNAYNGGPGGSFTSEFNDHPLDTNKWYHMVLTDDLVNLRYYVNNVLGVTLNRNGFGFKPNGVNGNPAAGGAATVLGQRSDDAFDPFFGSIDEVAVYNYALTPQQIQSHFRSSTRLSITRSGNNIVLTWPVGDLQAAPAVTGTYTNVPGVTSPHTNSIGGAQIFYRVQVY